MVALCPDPYTNTSTTEDEQGSLQAYTGSSEEVEYSILDMKLTATTTKITPSV